MNRHPSMNALCLALGAQLIACGGIEAETPVVASTPDAGANLSDASASLADAGTNAEDAATTARDPATYAAIIQAAPWAADMTLSFANGTLTVADDGIPDRGRLEAYAIAGGATTAVVSSPYSHAISMSPEIAAQTTETTLGAIGVTLSGGLLFNPYDGGGMVAIDGNYVADGVPFIDPCNGHPVPSGMQYHYHGVPYCITDTIDVPGQHSSLLGVLLDGFPLYGAHGIGGGAPTDLDACNGHQSATPEFPGGIYHYHLSETAPYSITCYSGKVTAQAGGGGGGGGGPGGMSMACANPPTGAPCCGDGTCDGPETTANCAQDCR